MIKVLPNATIVTILQYFSLSNQCTVHLKLTQCYVNYITDIFFKSRLPAPAQVILMLVVRVHTQRKDALHAVSPLPPPIS